MKQIQTMTGKEAGLSGEQQIRIALKAILDNGGVAPMPMLYKAVEQHMNGTKLSKQGRASLRNFINTVAKNAHFVYPRNPKDDGWRITPEGKEFLAIGPEINEEVLDLDTDKTKLIPSNSARGAAFELYTLELLRRIYPDYAWYQQGIHKNEERGLDFIGSRIGNDENNPLQIGAQVKLHKQNDTPSPLEWFKFLAGCFSRRIGKAVFITSGRLNSWQRREAGEAGILIIEGREEINRIAGRYEMERFELFDES